MVVLDATEASEAASRCAPPRGKAEINAVAADLASKMGDLHGGKWLVHIEHRMGFILIRQRGDGVGNSL